MNKGDDPDLSTEDQEIIDAMWADPKFVASLRLPLTPEEEQLRAEWLKKVEGNKKGI